MKCFWQCLVVGMFSLGTCTAFATEYTVQTKLTYFGRQGTRPIQPSTENHDWLSFSSATWTVTGGSGGAVCPAGVAVLPEDEPTMRAIALAAAATGATVVINVDNSLPLVGSYCQVTTIYLAGQ